MSDCIICSTEVFRVVFMNDKDTLERLALKAIQALLLGMGVGKIERRGVGKIEPTPRRGICIVERCAQFIEASCGSCHGLDCQCCVMATKLREAEDRINAERDAELAELSLDDADPDSLLAKIVEDLCTEHVAFGLELVRQWYNRRSFLPAVAVIDDASHGS